MIDDVINGHSVILDLEPATALLLCRAVQAGMHALNTELSADDREQLVGLSMFLADAAADRHPLHQGESRMVA
jgi:hypothetical protein